MKRGMLNRLFLVIVFIVLTAPWGTAYAAFSGVVFENSLKYTEEQLSGDSFNDGVHSGDFWRWEVCGEDFWFYVRQGTNISQETVTKTPDKTTICSAIKGQSIYTYFNSSCNVCGSFPLEHSYSCTDGPADGYHKLTNINFTDVYEFDPSIHFDRNICGFSVFRDNHIKSTTSEINVQTVCDKSKETVTEMEILSYDAIVYDVATTAEVKINNTTPVNLDSFDRDPLPDVFRGQLIWRIPVKLACGDFYKLKVDNPNAEVEISDIHATITSCSASIDDFHATPTAINPNITTPNLFSPVKPNTQLVGTISSTGSVTWKIEIAGKSFTGTGNTVSATWDGRDASGNVVAPGNYTATLYVTSDNGCILTSSTTVTVESCAVTITNFNASNPEVNPKAGTTTIFSANISDGTSSALFWEISIGERLLAGTGSVSATWDGKNAFGQPLAPGTYTAELRVGKSDGTCTAKEYLPIQVVQPTDDDCKNVKKFASSVNVASGVISDSFKLFSLPKQIGTPLEVSLEYISKVGLAGGPLGNGWRHNFDITAKEWPNGNVSYADGSVKLLYKKEGNIYISSTGDTSTLAKNGDGSFTVTYKDGSRKLFDPYGKLMTDLDANGAGLIFSYAEDRLATVTDAYNRVATFNYDGITKKLSYIVDPAGNRYYLSYSSDNLLKIEMPEGVTWNYTYTSDNQMSSKVDPEGNTTYYTYDTVGRVISATDPNGIVRTLDLPAGGSVVETTSFTEKDGGIWRYTYDNATGKQQSVTDPAGRATTYTYDTNGNVLTETDPLGNITGYTWDEAGNRTSVTDPLGNTTSYTYNDRGQPLTITDALGKVTTNTYDANGNMLTTTNPLGAMTINTYDAYGRVLTVTDPLSRKTTYDYVFAPGIGLTVTATDPLGMSVTLIYEEKTGNLIQEKNNIFGYTKIYGYDKLNRLTVTNTTGVNPGETYSTETYIYDHNGNKISENIGQQITNFHYNYKGQLIRKIDALTNSTTYSYSSTGCSSCGDGVDKLASITDANGNLTTFEYDLAGNLIKEIDAQGHATSYEYNAIGLKTSRTDANGATTIYSYDANRRLTTIGYPDGTSVNYTYDTVGRMLTATNQNIGYMLAHDAAGNVLSVSDTLGRMVSYTYDLAGNRTNLVAPDGMITTYTYNAQNMPTSIKAPKPVGTFSLTYDAGGRLSKITNPNGTSNNYTYYSHIDHLWLLTSTTRKGAIIASEKIVPTLEIPNNILVRENQLGQRWDFVYDALFRLLRYTNSINLNNSYTYDATGNRLTTTVPTATYLYGPSNELQTKGTTIYQYDYNGNLIRKADGITNNAYAFDYENRLKQVVMTTGNTTSTVDFKYDPFGRRIEKSVTSGGTTTATGYLYDKHNILYEYNDSTVTTRYVHNLGVDDPLGFDRSGKRYIYHKDHQGSVMAITDRRGAVVQKYEYLPFGEISLQQSDTFNQAYTYTGREWDKETGLYYYRARYYDPVEGRFISKDPFAILGNIYNSYNKNLISQSIDSLRNTYAYTDNNPINWTDPSGLLRWHGNWGGPGWTAGKFKPESQLTANDLSVPALDDRDACYKRHDICIWENTCKIQSCDHELASCLRNISPFKSNFWITSQGYPVDVVRESLGFDTFIPYVYHK